MSADQIVTDVGPERLTDKGAKVETFVRDVFASYDEDLRRGDHDCSSEELVAWLMEKARATGVLTPRILAD